MAYWGETTDSANAVVRPEVVVFQPPVDQPAQARDSLTKTVPKARTIPNRVVMTLAALSVIDGSKLVHLRSCKPFSRLLGKNQFHKCDHDTSPIRRRSSQLLVFSLKPMTAEKKAQGLVGDECEMARMCLQCQNHEGFQVQNSTTNADAHLLRLFLAVQANPKHVLASFDVSNAFLNAELSEDFLILTQPPPELIQFEVMGDKTL